MNYSTTFNFLHPNRYCWYLFKSLICCLCIFLISPQLSAQVTPPGATNDTGCGEDCFDFFNFAPLTDGAGNTIPNVAEGVAEDNNCNTIIDGAIEYSGADTSPDLTGSQIGANNQGTSTDNWTVTFGAELTNPIIQFSALRTQTEILITDCSGNPITATCVASCGANLTFTPGVGWSGDAAYTLQLSGAFDCVQISADIENSDTYSFSVGTCLSAAPIPPCTDCGPNERLRYLTLTNQTGSGTGATADVNLNGVLYGTAEVLFSDLSINEDLSGSAFGAFAQDDESFILRVDLCEAITVQQIDILGLETESQVWVGNTLTGTGASAIPGGITLMQCGGRVTMAPTGNMVTNISSSCANQGNGNYTVTGGLTTNTLFFRYTNPAGGCSFDKATFRIGACVSDVAEVIPTCPLTEVTLTDDPEGYAAAILAGGNGNNFTTTVTRDANGNYFDQTCSQIQNETENATPTALATISPCAEVVDENDCEFCTPVPPCVTCGPNENYEYLTLANATGSGTGTTADVFLNGVLYGDAEVLFSNLSINEDLSGSAFGAFANGAAMEETFVLQVNLCEPITVQQVDILGLETESQVWVGTELSGTGMNATPTGITLTQCDGSATLSESGNMVTNNASSCSNQSNGNYTVGSPTVSTLYFRYTNPAGGCRFDKATFRIGTCVPDLPEAIPTCPLVLLEVTEQDGVTTSSVYRDLNGLFFNTGVCTDPVDTMTLVQSIAISPCATIAVTGECEFCCEFVVTCPANTDLGTFDCNTLGNIPAAPSVMISPTGNITVDNAAGDYQINVGNMPCGTIVANTSDDITVPDICSTGGQVITRTVTIFDDENGNGVYDMASEDPPVSCIFTINITEDTTPPVITCPADVTIECTDDTSTAANGMATATDNCSSTANIVITFTDNNSQANSGCGQYEYTIIRNWVATDACGNTASCLQTIEVEDSTSPVITCPADITLPCNTDPLPIATSISEFIAIGGTVTDNCSNLDELTLTLTNSPASPSMLNFCPGTPEADRTLTRTYTITDICGNVSTCAQRFIYLESTTGPVITAIPLDQTIDCSVNAIPQLSLFAAESDCININYTVTGLPVTGTLDCPGSDIQFLYTATDDCGRTATHIQTYTLVNDLPEFVCPTSICVIESPADTDALQEQFDDYASLATVITSCAGNGYSVSNNFNPNGFIPQSCTNPTVAVNNAIAYQVVTFSATDNCGRNASCTAVVVLQDNNGPVLSGTLSFGQADCNDNNLQADYTDWANTQLNGLSATDDNPGSVAISYTPLSPNVDCSNGIATTQVTFTATDDCGNVSSQTTVYQIFDNAAPTTATVFGTIATEADETMALVEVSADGGASNQMTTTSDGYYHFDLEMANNYTITPDRTDDPMNGITTYDLILLGQHLLEINTLDSPYKIIAADVNESGHISSLDMIELRRLILQITDEFSSGKSWTFVDAGYNFPQPTNPFATTFPTAYNINHLDNNEHINFVGVKLGDLNGSANPSLLQAGDTRSSDGTLNINLEDQFIKAGQTYQLEFKADKFEEILGFQFTIDFANDYLAFADYQTSKLEGMNRDNLGFTKVGEGKITVSWNENQAVSLANESTLFQLSFTALQDGQLSELLSFNSSLIAQEAYQGNLRKKVELGFQNTALSDQKFALFQNRPNPFVEKTVIGFQLPEATEATLTIFDIAGRVVWTQTTEYAKGLHQVTIDEQKLGEEGIYFYQLSTRRTTATKKLILVD